MIPPWLTETDELDTLGENDGRLPVGLGLTLTEGRDGPEGSENDGLDETGETLTEALGETLTLIEADGDTEADGEADREMGDWLTDGESDNDGSEIDGDRLGLGEAERLLKDSDGDEENDGSDPDGLDETELPGKQHATDTASKGSPR